MKRSGHKSRGGKNDYDSLKARLRQLAQTTVAFTSGTLEGVAGAFFAGFALDNETGEGVCITNPIAINKIPSRSQQLAIDAKGLRDDTRALPG